ncbi:MAG: hypothetical protein VYE77_00730 [Planctomycetota bacterium]|nr:hypothetical protein [Planctomycetota bacterium]
MSEARRDSILLTAGLVGLLVVLWIPESLPSLGGRSELVAQAILGLLCLSLCFAVLWRRIRNPRAAAGKNFERATVFSWWFTFVVVSLVAVFLSPWVGNLANAGLYGVLLLGVVLVVVRACSWVLALTILCPVTWGMVTAVGGAFEHGLGASIALGLFLLAARPLPRLTRSWWVALAVALGLTIFSDAFLSSLTFSLLMGVLVSSRGAPCLSERLFHRRLRLPA